jgi:hypothetical protein
LSTSLKTWAVRHRQASGVASSDDINTPVEKPGKNIQSGEKRENSGARPPGEFVSEELEEQTARFIEDVKGRAQRRSKDQAGEPHGPPPPEDDQRSRRR